MTVNRSGRPSKRELEDAKKEARKLLKRVEGLQKLGMRIPPSLLRQLQEAQRRAIGLEWLRKAPI